MSIRAWILLVAVAGAAAASFPYLSGPARADRTSGDLTRTARGKPSPGEALRALQAGNRRFVSGHSIHPHTDATRLAQAGTENQGDHAIATVITCSDSRVPVERIFDAGVMDLFVVRVAGNVCDEDEAGSIEYGLAHVRTPLLVVLGHTQCGAVLAVTHALQGRGHRLERNIPGLVDNIQPAVERAMRFFPYLSGDKIVPASIEENVWQSIEDLFSNSPATRRLVREGQVQVVGAIYDVATGAIDWLPAVKVDRILANVEANPERAIEEFAEGAHTETDPHAEPAHPAPHGESQPPTEHKAPADPHRDH